MNIFVTSDNPIKCAEILDNKRVVKMVLESAQILSTAINESWGTGPYKTTHKDHPCVKWTMKSKENYSWLLTHFVALCCEYTKRYRKTHKCAQHIETFIKNVYLFPNHTLTPFPNCTIFKDEPNTYKAYEMHLKEKWKNDKKKPIWQIKGVI